MSDWEHVDDALPAADQNGNPVPVLVELDTGEFDVLAYDADDSCWFDPSTGNELLRELIDVEYWRHIPKRQD